MQKITHFHIKENVGKSFFCKIVEHAFYAALQYVVIIILIGIFNIWEGGLRFVKIFEKASVEKGWKPMLLTVL